jgi:hypothetical protein
VKALGSDLLFGKEHPKENLSTTIKGAVAGGLVGGVIGARDVSTSQPRRMTDSTGIYDANGNVRQDVLNQYLDAFGPQRNSALNEDQVVAVLVKQTKKATKKGALGFVEHAYDNEVFKLQFKSLFDLCEKINGKRTVTREQFSGFFDGSLLYMAAQSLNKK